jgi:hypothetical protein
MHAKYPYMLHRLGRAHTGLADYELAAMYLQAALGSCAALPDSDVEKGDLHLVLLLEHAVCASLSGDRNKYQDTMSKAFGELFPSGRASAKAPKMAMHFFQEGGKNQDWRRDGKPIRACQIHALGFYEVSADLNRRMGEDRGLGLTLINMGDICRDLGDLTRARHYWREAVEPLQRVGDSEHVSIVRERLRTVDPV